MIHQTSFVLQLTIVLGINCYLRSVQDHYNMRRWSPDQESQLNFETINGKRCLVYREDFISKTHDGGLGDMKNRSKRKLLSSPMKILIDALSVLWINILAFVLRNIGKKISTFKVLENPLQLHGTDTR